MSKITRVEIHREAGHGWIEKPDGRFVFWSDYEKESGRLDWLEKQQVSIRNDSLLIVNPVDMRAAIDASMDGNTPPPTRQGGETSMELDLSGKLRGNAAFLLANYADLGWPEAQAISARLKEAATALSTRPASNAEWRADLPAGTVYWPCAEHAGLVMEGVATSVAVPLKTVCPHCAKLERRQT